jgi:hypothetical protein
MSSTFGFFAAARLGEVATTIGESLRVLRTIAAFFSDGDGVVDDPLLLVRKSFFDGELCDARSSGFGDDR